MTKTHDKLLRKKIRDSFYSFYTGKTIEETQKQMMQLIEEEKKLYAIELIGEDEVEPVLGERYYLYIPARNRFRAELRKKAGIQAVEETEGCGCEADEQGVPHAIDDHFPKEE